MYGLKVLVRRILLVIPILVLMMLGGYIIEIWKWIPDTVASHFNFSGVPNQWSGKVLFVAIFLILEFGVCSWIYIKIHVHQKRGSIGFLYFVFMFISYVFWLSLRTNVQHGYFPIMSVLPGALCGLVCALLAAWSMSEDVKESGAGLG